MPHDIILSEIPIGYALSSGADGDMVDVRRQEFTSSEDGDLFISRLEGIPRMLLSLIPGYSIADESTLSHMLAIIRSDKTATIYLNELDFIGSARVKHSVKKDDFVTLDNILDIERISIRNVTISPTDGIVFILSSGWRKGLFFDLTPLPPSNENRDYDFESLLGFYTSYLYFQHLFSIPNAVWDEFFRQDWFPFIHLRQHTLKQMINSAKSGQLIDAHLQTISKDIEAEINSRLETWRSHPIIKLHFNSIEAAFSHFKKGDYLSASAILFPRIEGVMRSHHFNDPNPLKASQGNLVRSALSKAPLPAHKRSLLLPERFGRFLTEKYFASFDPANPQNLSRHTISHGVVPESLYNQKSASLAFLILLQLASLLPNVPSKPLPA